MVLGPPGRADLVEMVNGDHYSGLVLSVTSSNVAVRSEVQGQITLPRAKVARITFRENAVQPAAKLSVSTNAASIPRLTLGTPSPGLDTNILARLQQELGSDPDGTATRKYSELARKLMTGSLSVSELRRQAQQTISEAEQMKQELGPEAGEMLDGYLGILRRFVEGAAPAEKK